MKIYLFALTEFTNVTDGQTDRQTPHDGIGLACIASDGKYIGCFIDSTCRHCYRNV